MKATRTHYDDMWEKYFENYQGWLYVADRLFPSRERHDPEENIIVRNENDTCCILSNPEYDSSDKLYPVDNDNYYINNVQTENYSYNEEPENSEATEVIINTVNDCAKESSHTFDAAKETSTEKIVRCRPFIKQPDDIIFECDTGLGFAFVTQKNESLIYTPLKACATKTLGSISIDTTCLKKPITKILFSCNVFFKPRAVKGTSQLEFVLSRSCNNCAENTLGSWIFDLIDKSEHISQTFKFNFCSRNSFPGFYNYFIRVIPVYIKNCSVLLTNCHIGAFAQSK
ncbi:MAG: DUF4489 domain-containing protein [Acetivibrionales bacterium]|jgi:hypothetical protein